jgi:hypothetical protein
MTPIQETIIKVLESNPRINHDWEEISREIARVHQIRKGKWLQVRDCLQDLINSNTVARVQSTECEAYYLTQYIILRREP